MIAIQLLVALAALVQPMSKTTFANAYQTVALAQPMRMHQPTNANATQIAHALRTEIAVFVRSIEKRIRANVVESGATLQCPFAVFDYFDFGNICPLLNYKRFVLTVWCVCDGFV